MTRRVLIVVIVAGVLLAAGTGIVLLTRQAPIAPQAPTAGTPQEDARRPDDTTQAQIEQPPRRSQEVFMPPASSATGTSPPAPERR
ncbi:hypothetical protein [Peristeroidobacter soli]|jgi:hypothetical protein|uniref:hypothetical protein n=1 Tax=Peristeroidobacter soli TaxID=2497877 RepID=UPI00101D2BAA|nr:hypothetical protein [Peristeroidobacter soli]